MSKSKRNGGYVLVDFSGVNLWDENPQVIPGIFTAVDTALKTNKPIIAVNAYCKPSDLDLKVPATPIPLFGYHDIGANDEIDPNVILLYANTIHVNVMRDGATESIQIVG